MSKKKIAIILDEMSMGGIPKACITLLDEIKNYYDVTMIMVNESGILQNEIPEEVKVKVFPYAVTRNVVKVLLKGKHFIKLFNMLIKYAYYSKLGNRWVKCVDILSKNSSLLIDEEFDCAIAYHGMNIRHLTRTLHQIRAKKKIAWIHGNHPFEGVHKKDAQEIYLKFDKIYCVSDANVKSFINDFPKCKSITETFYNIFNVDYIKKMSLEECEIERSENKTVLVTVGRLSPEKGQDMIPEIAEMLKDKGCIFEWYVVGDGETMPQVSKKVDELKLNPFVKLVGSKKNPYPYMKNSDIYVQPSYTEGYPVALRESAILGTAIVATDVGGTAEGFNRDTDAVFVKAEPKAIFEAVYELITNKDKCEKLKNRVKELDFSNKSEVEKLKNFIG